MQGLLLTLVSLIPAAALMAESSSVASSAIEESASDQLQQQLQKLQAFSAHFKQTVYGAAYEELQSSEGVIAVVRPLKFKWQLEEPYPQTIVTAGDILYIYDPDLEQVQLRDASEALKGTPALLLAGDPKEVDALFNIALIDTNVYSLRPKQADSLYSEIRFFFTGDEPTAIEIRDSLGQLTRIDFHEQKLNAKVSDDEFIFNIPEGTDVIGDAKISAS